MEKNETGVFSHDRKALRLLKTAVGLLAGSAIFVALPGIDDGKRIAVLALLQWLALACVIIAVLRLTPQE